MSYFLKIDIPNKVATTLSLFNSKPLALSIQGDTGEIYVSRGWR